MRDRLIELIQNAVDGCARNWAEIIADYLLENGVIVLPYEIRNTVYCISTPCGGCEAYNEPMQEEFIKRCQQCKLQEIIECKFDYDLIPEWGKTVFLTREEAEAALKARDLY